jgi:hypothetical protein
MRIGVENFDDVAVAAHRLQRRFPLWRMFTVQRICQLQSDVLARASIPDMEHPACPAVAEIAQDLIFLRDQTTDRAEFRNVNSHGQRQMHLKEGKRYDTLPYLQRCL